MKKYIIFDFDGVILDSFETAYEIMKGLNAEFNLFKLSKEKMRTLFEENVWDAYEKEGLKGELKNQYTSKFKEKYLEKRNELKFFKRIRESLIGLSERYSLNIISSNLSEIVNVMLLKEVLLDSFHEVIGAEVKGNKREKITEFIKRHNAKPSDVYFISDTNGDINEVIGLNIHPVSVSWGFHDKERLRKSKSEIILDSPEELLRYFENLKQ